MSSATVRCPYCQRQYMMKLSREEIVARKMRATCGRCGQSFDVASRIVEPGAARLAPPVPPTRSKSTPTASGPNPVEELEALTREIVAAAEQISANPRPMPVPVSSETQKAAIADVPTPAPTRDPVDAAIGAEPVGFFTQDNTSTQTIRAIPPSGPPAPVIATASPSSSQTLAAIPAMPPEPSPPEPPPPLTWTDRADPGLAGFSDEADAGLRALTQLLG